MFRIKRVHRSLLLYVVTFYCFVLLVYQQIVVDTSDRVLEEVMEYEDYSWIKLSDDIYILSAYYDNRPVTGGPFIRVLTIAKYKKELLVKKSVKDLQPKTYGKEAFNVVCSIEDGTSKAKELEYEAVIFEEGGKQFAATFINCFMGDSSSVPTHVSLRENGKPVRIPVKHLIPKNPSRKSNKSSVCVRALFGPYDNVNQIGHIQSHKEATSVSIDLVDWNLPHELQDWEVLWDFGALIALTDCVYRSMAEYGYAYIVDMDEFVVPRQHIATQDTQALVDKIGEYKRPPINKTSHAFLFKNTFFCSEFNEESDFDNRFDVFSIPYREDFFWSYKLRAKMLVKTEEVVAVGHHRIHDWVKPGISYNTPVPEQVSLLHHYRSCEGVNTGFSGLGAAVLKNKKIEDKSIFKFKHVIDAAPVTKIIYNAFR